MTKLPRPVIYYHNYKQFDEMRFRNDISCDLNSNKNKNDASFEKIKSNIMTELEQCASMKKNILHANNSPFMK